MTIPFKCSDLVRFKIADTDANVYRVITIMYNSKDAKWKVMLKGGPDFKLDIGTFDAEALEKCSTTPQVLLPPPPTTLPEPEIKYNVWVESTYNNNAPRHSNKMLSKEDLYKLIGRYVIKYDGVDDYKSNGAIKQIDFCKIFTSGAKSYVATVTLVYWDVLEDSGAQEHFKNKPVVITPLETPKVIELHPKMKAFVDAGFLKEIRSWR